MKIPPKMSLENLRLLARTILLEEKLPPTPAAYDRLLQASADLLGRFGGVQFVGDVFAWRGEVAVHDQALMAEETLRCFEPERVEKWLRKAASCLQDEFLSERN